MGSTELAANLFRATQAEDRLRREKITPKDQTNRAHREVGAATARRFRLASRPRYHTLRNL